MKINHDKQIYLLYAIGALLFFGGTPVLNGIYGGKAPEKTITMLVLLLASLFFAVPGILIIRNKRVPGFFSKAYEGVFAVITGALCAVVGIITTVVLGVSLFLP